MTNAILLECERHFAKPDRHYYSVLHRTVDGGGFIIIQKYEWQAQPTLEAKAALINSRLISLERTINQRNANDPKL